MSELPLVSVIAVCYNHAKYVVETLDSIKAQTYPNIELVIMDDCSTDNSAEVIQEWIDRNTYQCQFIAHKENEGLCRTLNEALNLTKGEYYQGLACDDIIHKDKLNRQVEIFNSYPSVSLVHSSANKIDENGKTIIKGFNLNKKNKIGVQDNHLDMMISMVEGNIVIAPSVLIKVSSLPTEPVYSEKYFFEDLYLNMRLLFNKNDFFFINIPLVNYRVLKDSMVRSKKHKNVLQIDRCKILLEFIGCNDLIDKAIIKKTNKLISFKNHIDGRLSVDNYFYLVILKLRSYLKKYV